MTSHAPEIEGRTEQTQPPLGAPEEIARVVSFLAADASAYITGQIWAVNGGLDI
jgi:NAD(P)-dependent dehydrogenase (short-subunit alcohol dehydrogenase family)